MTTQELIAKSQADYANFMFWWWATLAIILALDAIALLAAIRILRRMGLSGWWSLLIVFYPPIGLLVMAIRRWPAFDKNSN